MLLKLSIWFDGLTYGLRQKLKNICDVKVTFQHLYIDKILNIQENMVSQWLWWIFRTWQKRQSDNSMNTQLQIIFTISVYSGRNLEEYLKKKKSHV